MSLRRKEDMVHDLPLKPVTKMTDSAASDKRADLLHVQIDMLHELRVSTENAERETEPVSLDQARLDDFDVDYRLVRQVERLVRHPSRSTEATWQCTYVLMRQARFVILNLCIIPRRGLMQAERRESLKKSSRWAPKEQSTLEWVRGGQFYVP